MLRSGTTIETNLDNHEKDEKQEMEEPHPEDLEKEKVTSPQRLHK